MPERGGFGTGVLVSYFGLGFDGFGDAVGESVTVGGIRTKPGFSGVGEVAEFEENAGDVGISGESESSASESEVAIFDRNDGFHSALDSGGEAVGVDSPVVGFGAAGGPSAASGGVVVQAEENGAVSLAGEADSFVEINEAICFAKHDDLEVIAEFVFESSGGVECEVFFGLSGGF